MSPSPKFRRKLKGSQVAPEPVARKVWTIPPPGTLWVGLVMLVIGALCGLAIQPLFTSTPTQVVAQINQNGNEAVSTVSQATPTQDNSPRGQMMRGVVNQTRHFIGEDNAPVTIVEFCDFDVPECGKFVTDTYSQFKEAYIDTGIVRFGYWSMVTEEESSLLAAEAAECAAEQDGFWQFFEAVFKDWVEGTRSFDKTSLNVYATELDLDTAVFNECLDSGEYLDPLKEGTTTIQNLGLPDVPTFLINGQPLIGFQSFESLQQTIDALITG